MVQAQPCGHGDLWAGAESPGNANGDTTTKANHQSFSEKTTLEVRRGSRSRSYLGKSSEGKAREKDEREACSWQRAESVQSPEQGNTVRKL